MRIRVLLLLLIVRNTSKNSSALVVQTVCCVPGTHVLGRTCNSNTLVITREATLFRLYSLFFPAFLLLSLLCVQRPCLCMTHAAAGMSRSRFTQNRAHSSLFHASAPLPHARTGSRSAFLLYLNVKLVPFFAFVLEGRSISNATWISAFLAFAGTVLLSSDGTPPNVGDLWSVLAAATSAMFILRLEKYSGSCDASRLNSANLWITAGLCGVWAGG